MTTLRRILLVGLLLCLGACGGPSTPSQAVANQINNPTLVILGEFPWAQGVDVVYTLADGNHGRILGTTSTKLVNGSWNALAARSSPVASNPEFIDALFGTRTDGTQETSTLSGIVTNINVQHVQIHWQSGAIDQIDVLHGAFALTVERNDVVCSVDGLDRDNTVIATKNPFIEGLCP